MTSFDNRKQGSDRRSAVQSVGCKDVDGQLSSRRGAQTFEDVQPFTSRVNLTLAIPRRILSLHSWLPVPKGCYAAESSSHDRQCRFLLPRGGILVKPPVEYRGIRHTIPGKAAKQAGDPPEKVMEKRDAPQYARTLICQQIEKKV